VAYTILIVVKAPFVIPNRMVKTDIAGIDPIAARYRGMKMHLPRANNRTDFPLKNILWIEDGQNLPMQSAALKIVMMTMGYHEFSLNFKSSTSTPGNIERVTQ
jgi:hypothetical protein